MKSGHLAIRKNHCPRFAKLLLGGRDPSILPRDGNSCFHPYIQPKVLHFEPKVQRSSPLICPSVL